MIPHKEDRFILPVMPFLFYLCGDFLYRKIKTHGHILGKVLVVFCAYEVILMSAYFHCE
jgi:hypothetical protein